MEARLKLWLGLFAVTTLLVLISIEWIDRPTAILVHEVFGSRSFSGLADSRGLSIPLASAVVFAICGVFAVAGRTLFGLGTTIVLSDIALLAGDTVKDQLKAIFGRTWPDSWGPGIVSLIHDGAYRFDFFSIDGSTGSFPSGHATAAASVASVLWFIYPRLRLALALGIFGVDAALVLFNLHFVSDVIAGTFVGFSAGLFVVALSASLPAPAPK